MSEKNPFAPPDPAKPLPPREVQDRFAHSKTKKKTHGTRPQAPYEPPSQEQLKEMRSRTWRFLFALLAFFFASGLPIPVQVIAPLVGVWALYLGVRVVLLHFRLKLPGLGLPMALMGLMLCMYLFFGSVSNLVLWNEQLDRQECMAGALTHVAQERCLQEFNDAVQQRLSSLTSG